MRKDFPVIFYKEERYFVSTNGYYVTRRSKRLHCEIWKDTYGSIPKKFHIHHRDGCKTNNNLDNLECLSHSEHMKVHALERMKDPVHLARIMKNVNDSFLRRKSWICSEAGRNYLTKISRVWNMSLPKLDFFCLECNKAFKSVRPWAKFCCSGHKHRYQERKRRRRLKVPMEPHVCDVCKKVFYPKRTDALCCSVSCGHKRKWKLEKQKRVCG